MNSIGFVSGNRGIELNQFHFEWCPKYRKHILRNTSVVQLIEESLVRTAQLHNIIIHISTDHIHLFVSLPFNMGVSEAFKLFKGRCSKELFRAFPSFRKMFRKGHLWSPGKFCRSISNVKAETIGNYIEKHQFKELNQSIRDARAEAEQMRRSSFF